MILVKLASSRPKTPTTDLNPPHDGGLVREMGAPTNFREIDRLVKYYMNHLAMIYTKIFSFYFGPGFSARATLGGGFSMILLVKRWAGT